MRIDPLNQLTIAAVSVLLGAVLGVLYDIFRILRSSTKSVIITVLTDVIYCLTVCASLFLLGYSLGGGHPRGYMAVFAVCGGTLYFALLSKIVRLVLSFLADMLVHLINIILMPFRFILQSIKKLMIFFKNFFYYKKKWYTINLVKNMGVSKLSMSDNHTLRGSSHEAEKGWYYY